MPFKVTKMDTEKTKLKSLLENWPMHTIVTASWLLEQGYSYSNIQKYIRSSWIQSVGTSGAYKRPHDTISWEGAVYGLQQQHPHTFYVGGKSALEKQGAAHYVSFGQSALFLFTNKKQGLPFWIQDFVTQKDMTQYHFYTKLLPENLGLTSFDCGEFSIQIASRERAALEMAELLNKHHTFEECRLVFENLSTLRPQLMQELLEACTSIKAKRVFLFLSDKLNLPWMKHINTSTIDLGQGERQLTPQGYFDAHYKITYPKDLFENDTFSV
jgi:hypothetical protein